MASPLRAARHELGYWALRVLLVAARAVPLPALRAAGSALGAAVLALGRRDRENARLHLRLAYPEAEEAWRESVLRRSGRHFGRLLGEVAWLWSASPGAILGRTRFEGLEHLRGSLAPERGAVLITAHCGNWEWMMLALGAAGVPMSVAAREVYDPRLDDIARRLRGRFGGETELRGEQAGRRLGGALRRGRVVGLLIDQDIEIPGVFTRFFGRPAWTPVGAAVLALRHKAPVVSGFAERLPGGAMRLAFAPPVAVVVPDADETAAARVTAEMTARIEAQIRAHPEQWVWMHKRWRRQPGPDERVWTVEDP
ncbi:MAG: lysophospholipid acyltransferase family protein [Acidobacteriota bacterium]